MPDNQMHTVNEKRGYVKISVIIVTYNAVKTLGACLQSIFNQTYPAIETIVIDGGSTDGTVGLLEKNCDKIAFWKSEKDDGIYDAMNKGVAQATGQWVYFLGADDTLLPGFSDIIPTLTDASAIYYANVVANGVKKSGKLNRYQFAKSGPYHQAIIYPKVIFDRYKFDTKYKITADFALTLQLCGDKSLHFVYRDYVLADFNPNGISGTQLDWAFKKEKPGLIYKNFGLAIWLRFLIRKLKNCDNPGV